MTVTWSFRIKPDLAWCPRFLEPTLPVDFLEPLDCGFFDDGLAIGYAVKPRFQRPTRDGERIVFPDKIFKVKLFHVIEQLGEAFRLKRAEHDANALGAPQPDIRACKHRHVP